MEIINPEIRKYLYDLGKVDDPILNEMAGHGKDLNCPIVGSLVGKLLYQLAMLIGARRVFEMGSGFGYSAYWFALVMADDGQVVLTDFSETLLDSAHVFFARAQMEHKIRTEPGDALEVIERYPAFFDIIFLDLDKHLYPEVLRKALPRIRKGGLLIADNVLWEGRVIVRDKSADTRGIQEFNNLIYATEELITTVIPLRDGVSVSVKR